MLSNLLPGLRELRAPLAAGYLWLCSVWLLFGQDFPAERDATGLSRALYDIADVLSPVGVGVALSFGAYLVGSMTADLSTTALRGSRLVEMTDRGYRTIAALVRRTWDTADPGRDGDWKIVYERALASISPEVAHALPREVEAYENLAATNDPDERKRIIDEFWVAPFWQEHVNYGTVNPRTMRWVAVTSDFREYLVEARDLPNDSHLLRRSAATFGLRHETENELDLVATRLLGREPELYTAVDRLRSEAELRFAIMPPLLVVTLILSFMEAWWLCLIGLAATAALSTQAVIRNMRAGDLLADALSLERVRAPCLERFLRLNSVLPREVPPRSPGAGPVDDPRAPTGAG